MANLALLVTVLLAGTWGQSHPETGSTSVRYGLCANVVAGATVAELSRTPGMFVIVVSLTEKASSEFRMFSEENIGAAVEVVFDGVALERATIRSAISSGKLQLGRWRSHDAATRMAGMLVDRSLLVPCGVLGSP